MVNLMLEPSEVSSTARVAVALVFLFAASAKLARPTSMSAALAVVQVPREYRAAVVRLLAVVEVAVAVALLTVQTRVVLLVPAVTLVAFSAFLGYLAYHRSSAACGCLGDLGSQSHWLGMTRNLCLLGLLALAAGSVGAETTAWSVIAGAQVAGLLVLLTEGVYVIHGLRVLEASRD